MVSQIAASAETFPSHPQPKLAVVEENQSLLSVIQDKIKEVNDDLKLPSTEELDNSLQLKIIEIGEIIGAEAERRSGVDFTAYKEVRAQYILNHNLAIGSEVLQKELRGDPRPLTKKSRKELDAQISRLKAKEHDAIIEIKKLRKEFLKLSKALSASYVEVLSEIRPLGGELKAHPKSHFLAKRVFDKTVAKIYPATWLEASNNDENLPIFKISFSGGVYKSPYSGTLRNVTGEIAMSDLIEVPVDKIEETIAKLTEGGDEAWLEEPGIWDGDEEPVAGIRYYARLTEIKKGKDDDGENYKPAGDHWFFGYVPDGDGKLPEEKDWYCHGYVIGSRKVGFSPTIDIPILNLDNEQNMAAYHEFIHHLQDRLSATLLRMEMAFSRYRTTVDGVRNPLVKEEDDPALPSDRYVREGNFADTYMGREYPFDRSLEILPTGAEAVFGGGYGGLMGFDDWNPDREHRNFVLGIFATV